MERYGVIYKITNSINNKVYIGQTVNSFKRRYCGGNLALQTHNKHLKNSINKYGIENFIIEEEYMIAYSKEELDELEIQLIQKFQSDNPKYGYNKKTGGANGKPTEETRRKLSESHKGYKMPYEQRKKISDAHKGRKPYKMTDEVKRKISNTLKGRKRPREVVEKVKLSRVGLKMSEQGKKNISEGLKEYYQHNTHHYLGKKFTDEHRANISKGRKGMSFSDSHRENLRKSKIGKELSDEHRKNISKSLKGRKQSKEWSDKIAKANSRQVICITTNKVFLNAKTASKYYGMNSHTNINQCCNGKQKSAGKLNDGTKLVWEYYDKNIHGDTEVTYETKAS